MRKRIQKITAGLMMLVIWGGSAYNTYGTFRPQRAEAQQRQRQTEASSFDMPKPIIAGVVPHHLLASEAITRFFAQLAKQKPKTIILLSPNHFHVGTTPLLTENQTITPDTSPVRVDASLVATLRKLLGPNIIDTQPRLVENDHGITNLMPFIHALLPHTTVVPILISAATSRKTLLQLTSALSPIISEKTPVILSSDFSHYLAENVALKKDAVTENLIETGNADRILELNNNDFLDSPEGLFTLMRLAAAKKTAQPKKHYHTTSNTLLGSADHNAPVTTYFIYTFEKKTKSGIIEKTF